MSKHGREGSQHSYILLLGKGKRGPSPWPHLASAIMSQGAYYPFIKEYGLNHILGTLVPFRVFSLMNPLGS